MGIKYVTLRLLFMCRGLVSLINPGAVSLLISYSAWESADAHAPHYALINHRLGWGINQSTRIGIGQDTCLLHTSCGEIEW